MSEANIEEFSVEDNFKESSILPIEDLEGEIRITTALLSLNERKIKQINKETSKKPHNCALETIHKMDKRLNVIDNRQAENIANRTTGKSLAAKVLSNIQHRSKDDSTQILKDVQIARESNRMAMCAMQKIKRHFDAQTKKRNSVLLNTRITT